MINSKEPLIIIECKHCACSYNVIAYDFVFGENLSYSFDMIQRE